MAGYRGPVLRGVFRAAETIFSLGNRFVGVRGTFEEGRPALSPGTFINGFHETWPIVHAEEAHALARKGQTIVNVPDVMILKLCVDDEPLFVPTARVHDYARVLDMRAGTLTREFVWATAAAKHVRARSCRLVSLEHRHVAALTYEVTVLDAAAPVAISSLVISHDQEQYLLEEGDPLKVIIRGEPHLLTPARPSPSRAHRRGTAEPDLGQGQRPGARPAATSCTPARPGSPWPRVIR